MNKLFFTLLFIFHNIESFGQCHEKVFYMDIYIYDNGTWSKLCEIDSLVDDKASNYFESGSIQSQVRSAKYITTISEADFNKRKTQIRLENHSFRLYFKVSKQLNKINVLSFSRNYMWHRMIYGDEYLVDEHLMEPAYVLPLANYMDFIDKDKLQYLKDIILSGFSFSFGNTFVSERSKYFHCFEIEFDDEKSLPFQLIDKELFQSYMLPLYKYPFESEKLLEVHEVVSLTSTREKFPNIDSIEVYGVSYHEIVGLAISLDFRVAETIENSKTSVDKTFFTIDIVDNFVGFKVKVDNKSKCETQIVWTYKKMLLDDLKDVTVQSGLEFFRGNYILSKFKPMF